MTQKTLLCTLCSHTIDEKSIIERFEKGDTHRIKHCTQCRTLYSLKKSSIKHWLAFALKPPVRFKTQVKKVKKSCTLCDATSFIDWNGRCPKCNSELLLRVA